MGSVPDRTLGLDRGGVAATALRRFSVSRMVDELLAVYERIRGPSTVDGPGAPNLRQTDRRNEVSHRVGQVSPKVSGQEAGPNAERYADRQEMRKADKATTFLTQGH